MLPVLHSMQVARRWKGSMPMVERSLRERALSELRKFAILAAYLWVCFGAIVFMRDAIVKFQDVSFLPWGFALIKALIIAKFVMLGEMLQPKEKRSRTGLWVSILRRTFFLLVVLVILTFLEEVVVSLIHGEQLSDAIARAAALDALLLTAKVLLMLLILLPYVGLRALADALGEDRLIRLLVAPEADAQAILSPEGSGPQAPGAPSDG
jgi:cytochrome bd-type quinol oxidase subunit 2